WRGDLVDHDRIGRRPGGADHPERRPDERALENFLVDKGLRVDVFQVPDTATGLHLGVAGHGEVRSLLARGLRVAGGGVAHRQRDVARGHVLAGADAEARLALVEEVARRLPLVGVHRLVAVVAPAIALPGVEGHAIAGADFLYTRLLHYAFVFVACGAAGVARLVGHLR